jgi:uncharacterized protein (TIGR02145 family)
MFIPHLAEGEPSINSNYWLLRRLAIEKYCFIVIAKGSQVIWNERFIFPPALLKTLKQVDADLKKEGAVSSMDKFQTAAQWYMNNSDVNVLKSKTNEKDTEPSLPKQKDIETSLVIQKSTFTDSRDGKTYKTVKIGNQEWMAENLAYLPAVYPSYKGSNNEMRYYVCNYQGKNVAKAKQQANYTTYGVLYNWPAAKAACPPGWHLPTDDEWTALENYLIASGYNYDGTTNDNKIAKSMAATSNWRMSSANGAIGNNLSLNNISGFSALPGGCRHEYGVFDYVTGYGGWWSSLRISPGTGACTTTPATCTGAAAPRSMVFLFVA